jgi:hypothetical protein
VATFKEQILYCIVFYVFALAYHRRTNVFQLISERKEIKRIKKENVQKREEN